MRSRCGSGLPSTVMRSLRRDVERRRGDRRAVDRHPAGRDPGLGLAPRGKARPRDHLGDALGRLGAPAAAPSAAGRGSEVFSRLPRNFRPRCAAVCCRLMRSSGPVMPGFMPGSHVFIHGWAIEVVEPCRPSWTLALDEARKAQAAGEVPVGCVIVRDGAVIAARRQPHAGRPRSDRACGAAGDPRRRRRRSAPSGSPTATSM